MTTFALDLSKAIEKAKGQTEAVIKKAAFSVFQSVIQKSPVDTGRFRANWNLSVGNPDLSTSEATDKTGSASIGKVASGITQYKLSDGSVFLTNNLPYAMRLEDGYSGQAPNGMVRLSIVEFNNYLASQAKNVR